MIRLAYWAQLLGAARVAARTSTENPEELATRLYEHWYAPEICLESPLPAPEDFALAVAVSGVRAPSRHHAGPAEGAVEGEGGPELAAIPTAEIFSATPQRNGVWIAAGDWYTCSPAWPDRRGTIVDLYFACGPAGQPQVIERLIEVLGEKIPYQIRCPVDRGRALRPEGISLSLPGAVFRTLAGRFGHAHRSVLPALRASSPMLTRPLAHGVSIAEQPPGASFGRSRARVLGYGMWPSWKDGERDETALASAALGALLREGIALEAPYRNPGSTADYTL